MSQTEERRKYFRVQLRQPICSELKIVSIYGKKVESRSSKIQIHDIGAGGVRFSSFLKFPVNTDAIFQFDFTLLSQFLSLEGTIVRIVELENGEYEYGVSFHMNETQSNICLRLLNDLAIRMHRKQSLQETSFCTLDTKCPGCSCSNREQAS